MFSVALPGAATGLPTKLAVTPVGSDPEMLSVTLPENPLSELTLIV